MSLRTRLVLSAALAVALAVSGAALFVYARTRGELQREVDATLRERADSLVRNRDRPGRGPAGGRPANLPPPPLGGAGGLTQLVDRAGDVRSDSGTQIPVTADTTAVATGTEPEFYDDVTVDGTPLRVYTTQWSRGVALQVARPLTETNAVLSDMGLALIVTAVAGVLVAAGLGFVVARGSFNAMLEELDESQRAQRRLAADASHELRTPLTSLRTNIEVLVRNEDLDLQDRERLMRDVNAQIIEVSALIGGMMEIARGDEPIDDEIADVQLDQVVASAVEGASFHWPAVRFVTDLTPSVVRGAAGRIELAVGNLLDNAGKWSPDGSTVEVAVRDDEVSVRDHGTGIDPADAPFVFDRFWRAGSARGTPGSGLGLAIVRQVADQHNAEVLVESPPDGGTLMRMRFPS